METRGNLSLRQVLQIQQHKQLLLSDGEKADQLPQQQSLTDNGLRGYCIAGLATIAFPDILFVAVLFWVAGMSPVFAALPESIIECQPYALLQEGREMDVTIKPAAHPIGTTVEVLDLFFKDRKSVV